MRRMAPRCSPEVLELAESPSQALSARVEVAVLVDLVAARPAGHCCWSRRMIGPIAFVDDQSAGIAAAFFASTPRAPNFMAPEARCIPAISIVDLVLALLALFL
jgi:hypothetical protein